MNAVSVSLAITPTVVSTLLTHYLSKKSRRHSPTADLSYDEGLHLIRAFLEYASLNTVDELQAFTAQWVPHPQWVKVKVVNISEAALTRAASLVQNQLGPQSLDQVGGRQWWQWRQPNTPFQAEWIEMRCDYNARKSRGDPGRRVMFYVHGGAYFFGGVDEHRYQLQRHARKLRARVFAPKYRLAPQFPFPCGLQDCLAAYLHLVTTQPANTIVLAGDSAGAGMILSILVILRDQGIELPAGAVLISPWVDLTHSFPSCGQACPYDFLPRAGFHHKPSTSWPPPNEDELRDLEKRVEEVSQQRGSKPLSNPPRRAGKSIICSINGKQVEVKDQIQMYTTNDLLTHRLVSPVMQPTLGGLPPLLVMVGGGELVRDEQIYLAHKAANPTKYLPPDQHLTDDDRDLINIYPPTDVQLQIWDDLCHVATTLSFTRPAKHMYRSIAQFSAWALARARQDDAGTTTPKGDDDATSLIASDSDSESESDTDDDSDIDGVQMSEKKKRRRRVGKAGELIPAFENHMIRQKVCPKGLIFELGPESGLAACQVPRPDVGQIPAHLIRRWTMKRDEWSARFAVTKTKVDKMRLKSMVAGLEGCGEGESPPPSARVGWRKVGQGMPRIKKMTRSYGLSLWSLWGSKHDEMKITKEKNSNAPHLARPVKAGEGRSARPFAQIESQQAKKNAGPTPGRVDQQVDGPIEIQASNQASSPPPSKESGDAKNDGDVCAAPPATYEAQNDASPPTPGCVVLQGVDMGVTGRRPRINGIALPFSLKKEPETASMMTLTSTMDQAQLATPRPGSRATTVMLDHDDSGDKTRAADTDRTADTPKAAAPQMPPVETFVAAQEDLPRAEKGEHKA